MIIQQPGLFAKIGQQTRCEGNEFRSTGSMDGWQPVCGKFQINVTQQFLPLASLNVSIAFAKSQGEFHV